MATGDGSPQLGEILSDYHSKLTDGFNASVRDAIESGQSMGQDIQSWAETQGEIDSSEPLSTDSALVDVFSAHCAYVTVNRVILYTYLRQSNKDSLPRLENATTPRTDVTLQELFERAAEQCGHPTGFMLDGPFNNLPTSRRVCECIGDLAKELEPLSLEEQLDARTLGDVYQTYISTGERREFGQFYTPRSVAELLAEWAIETPTDNVLDPCCGSGIITEACHDRLEWLTETEQAPTLSAIDISPVAAQMTAILLAVKSGVDTERIDVRRADFFDVTERHLLVDDDYDATVGNPPYVRQEKLPRDKDHYRKHLSRLGRDGSDEYQTGEKKIDGRADLYCYCLTHATEFLNEGGRLAWIIPTKWMLSNYGNSLKQFIYDHYSMQAIVSFDGRLFDDALVDTVLVFLERTRNPNRRENNTTRFIRVQEKMDEDEILSLINADDPLSEGEYMHISNNAAHRTIAVSQRHLQNNPDMNLHRFLTAPPIYTTLVEHPDTEPLGDVWTLSYGEKTGSNDIFLLPEEAKEQWGISDRFLSPTVKSIREVDGFTHTSEDAEQYLLDLSEYVRDEMVDDDLTSNLANRVLDSLEDDGFDSTADYIRAHEDHPDRTNPSVDSNRPWFDLGDMQSGEVLVPLAMDNRRDVIRTDGQVTPLNRFAVISTSDVELALALLNSNYMKLVFESHGRVTGGGAVNYAVSDIAEMPLPSPKQFTESQQQKLRELYQDLVTGQTDARSEIDRVILDALELDVEPHELELMANRLMMRRRGQENAELPELSGAVQSVFESDEDGQQRLDSYLDSTK